MNLDNLLSLHEETTTRCREIMRQKNMDYSGGDGDPFANFRIAESFGLHPVTGIILRMTDKLQRVRAFIKNGVCAVDGESVDDACDDLVNYAILMKGLLREERATLTPEQAHLLSIHNSSGTVKLTTWEELLAYNKFPKDA